VFSDIDVDGDPDLLLALDWGSLKLFLNDAGHFSDATADFGLDAFRSMWNGITTGDLDEDGRPDVVATSWGRNTTLRANLEHPVVLYYADFDQNGVLDIVEAQYDSELNGMSPLRSRIPLNQGIPFVARRVVSYHEYAETTVNDLLGAALGGAATLEVNTLDHTVLLNRGASFEKRPLPTEAQFAPAFAAGIADFDGDGHEDLFVSQNFFPNEPESGRYDAGRGLLMVGDGSGDLSAVPGQVSGIAVYGDQRGAAFTDYDGDARLDLAVSQNGAETKLYHNQGATSGIRVRLVGPPANPDAIGGVIRIVYAERMGPAREIHAGSGFWSFDGTVQVMGLEQGAIAVRVRWPGGLETEVPIAEGQREISITYSENGV
jgi:hypothetical protein